MTAHKKLRGIWNKIGGKSATAKIQIGNQIVKLNDSIWVLRGSLKRLTRTDISIKKEEASLGNIRNYWAFVRRGLIDAGLSSKVINGVDGLFKELGIELRVEDEISGKKAQLLNDEATLLRDEEDTTQKAGSKA